MAVREILLLGNPQLLSRSRPVTRAEVMLLRPVVEDLHDTMMNFRERYHRGRAIAAPQIGVSRRLVYMHIDAPQVFLNPVIEPLGRRTMVVWDDCMSFPELLVRVRRHRRIRIRFRDMQWRSREMVLEKDLAELLQHEVDHLDGILAVQRAIDGRSFALAREHARQSSVPAP